MRELMRRNAIHKERFLKRCAEKSNPTVAAKIEKRRQKKRRKVNRPPIETATKDGA